MTSPPPGPAGAGGDNRKVRVIVLVFLACFVAVAVWGASVVSQTRRTADRTDREVRLVGWLLLSGAAREGRFPASEAELRMAAAAGPAASVPSGEGWPGTAMEAWGGLAPPEAPIAEILTRIRVEFPRGEPPRVSVAALPTRLRTVPLVNEWIRSYAEAHPATLRGTTGEPTP